MASSVKNETVSVPYETIIGEDFDEDTFRVLRHLSVDSESTDEEIASKANMSVNCVRRALYKLYDTRIATYRRVRDTKTSYFVHLWKLLPVKSNIQTYKKKAKFVIEKLKQRLEFERKNVFYHCGNKDCPYITFDEAVESRFKCPVCSTPLQYVNNEKAIEFLSRKIDELKEEVENLPP